MALKVLVTHATRNAGLALLHGLAEAGNDAVGCDDRRLPFDLHSRHSLRHHVHPPPSSSGFGPALANIVEREQPDVVLPLFNAHHVAEHEAKIRSLTALPMPGYASISAARDKLALATMCRELGIPVPELYSLPEARGRLQHEPQVLVVKPRYDIGGAEGIHYVGDCRSLAAAFHDVESRYGAALIQEFIPGPVQCMRGIGVLYDQQTRLVARFTYRKLRQWPDSGGCLALGESTHDWELVEMLDPLFRKLKWCGPADVDVKIDPRDNRPRIIEVNPRFWASVRFPILSGVNFAALACEVALGREISSPSPPYPAGLKYVEPGAFLRSSVAAWAGTRGSRIGMMRRLVRELHGPRVGTFSDPRDFGPLIGKALLAIGAKPAVGRPRQGKAMQTV